MYSNDDGINVRVKVDFGDNGLEWITTDSDRLAIAGRYADSRESEGDGGSVGGLFGEDGAKKEDKDNHNYDGNAKNINNDDDDDDQTKSDVSDAIDDAVPTTQTRIPKKHFTRAAKRGGR